MPRYFLTCYQNPSLRVELFADGLDEFAIGRGYENNMILIRNKLISRRHCQLFKQPDKSVRLMCDSDVNGVVVNDRLLIFNGEAVTLHSGDNFYIIHSRKNPGKNLSFNLTFERTLEDSRGADDEELFALGLAHPVASTAAAADSKSPTSSLPSLIPDPQEKVNGLVQQNDELESTADNTLEASSQATNMSMATKAALKPEAQLSSSLQCSICLSILYDPVTLGPCMHNFCGGCCSGWLATNRRCPSCRHKISILSKNPSLRAILDGYVAMNPSQAKSAEERTMLDAANRLHFDRLFISGSCLPLNEHGGDLRRNDDTSEATNATSSVEQSNSAESDESDDDDDSDGLSSDDDDDDSNDDNEQANGWPLGSDTEIEEVDIPERHEFEHDSSSSLPVCRQCIAPEGSSSSGGSKSSQKSKLGATSGADAGAPSSSAESDFAFRCVDPLQHVLCNCCDSPMPDRRIDLSAPPQTCLICSLEFCNLYWATGCQNNQCQPGCLKLLKDIDLKSLLDVDLTAASDSSAALLLFGNQYETAQLREYCTKNEITATKLRDLLLDGLEAGKYATKAKTMIGKRPCRDTPVCSFCRVNIVQDLLFAYRRETRDCAADRRPNCPNGKYCVSQSQDQTHASVVNHICEPSPPGIVIDCDTFRLATVEHDANDGCDGKNVNRDLGSALMELD